MYTYELLNSIYNRVNFMDVEVYKISVRKALERSEVFSAEIQRQSGNFSNN